MGGDGMTPDDTGARWLSIIGIGEDGRHGLSGAALELIERAELVVGGARHLALVGEVAGVKRVWAVPLEDTIAEILAHRGRRVVVLASGDPFWFGVGTTLARHVPGAEMRVIPAPSSLSLAASRLGWALQDTVTLGLNSRPLETLVPHLHTGVRILALSVGAQTPGEVAGVLRARGFGASKVWVLEALGGPRERVREARAAGFDLGAIDPLNVVGIEVEANAGARVVARASGLPDELFEHDGQITKREIRAVTVAALGPTPGELLWDVGLGSGSVAIEWLLAHPSTRAIGFERDGVRAQRAKRNALALGVPRLEVRVGAAPGVMAACGEPDAVFIGGGASLAVLEASWRALRSGGRMVVNAVTIETEALLIGWHGVHGGSLTRVSVERVEAVGTKHGWRAAMPVVQWVGRKA